MNNEFEQYTHYGNLVWVRPELKGKHKEHCLCYSCEKLNPGAPEANCKIANLLYAVCLAQKLTTPVYECPEFTARVKPSKTA